jgi:cytochrome P450
MKFHVFCIAIINLFRSRVKDGFYQTPLGKLRVEYSSDPNRVAQYARSRFTRSRLVRSIIEEFHLSRNSLVVSDDNHVKWLKPLFLPHLHIDDVTKTQIAKDLLTSALPAPPSGTLPVTINISDELIRETYRVMLDRVLKVDILQPLDNYIRETHFRHATRPMVLEGVMIWLKLPVLLPRQFFYALEWLLFPGTGYMRRISKKLEQLIDIHSVPRADSWMSTLLELRDQGKLTQAQVNGEVTSMLSASISLSSALGSTLLCLASLPYYQQKIHDDPSFARYFIMEVLRLYPPFRQFGYERLADERGGECTPDTFGEFIISAYALHRKRDFWDRPRKFMPERFLDPEAAKGFRYLPFGMGKRICPGRFFSIALLEEAVKYICSSHSHIAICRRDHLPVGYSGCLVSFAIDDRLTYRAR